jgi:hypothetical protein
MRGGQRTFDAAFEHIEGAGNQKDNIIEVGVVVETGYPRWIWGTAVRGRA